MRKNIFKTNPSIQYTCILLLVFLYNFAFSQDKIELKNADRLTGKVINNQNVREAIGNVKFIHGNVTVYCNTAIQYFDANKIELIGNVKIFQDTLALYTEKSIYYGNEKTAYCESGITLKDPNATIRSDNGVYFFNEAKAIFKNDVIIINPEYKITSDELIYHRKSEESYARGKVVVTTDSAIIYADNLNYYKREGRRFAFSNVKIISDSTIITSDTLNNYFFQKKSFASGNVRLESMKRNTVIYGDYLENYENKNYSYIKGKTRLIRVQKNKDTLFIYSNIMEAYRNPPEQYLAKENVEIINGNFFSKSGYLEYINASKDKPESITLLENPVVWQDVMQLTGDSICAILNDGKVKTVYVIKLNNLQDSRNSFLIITPDNEYFKDRFDQITGTDITINFEDDKISTVNVYKGSRSIYFIYENNKANGMNISEGEDMIIFFNNDQKVTRIRVEKDTKGQYIPEVLINTVEKKLPGFEPRTDKPFRRMN